MFLTPKDLHIWSEQRRLASVRWRRPERQSGDHRELWSASVGASKSWIVWRIPKQWWTSSDSGKQRSIRRVCNLRWCRVSNTWQRCSQRMAVVWLTSFKKEITEGTAGWIRHGAAGVETPRPDSRCTSTLVTLIMLCGCEKWTLLMDTERSRHSR